MLTTKDLDKLFDKMIVVFATKQEVRDLSSRIESVNEVMQKLVLDIDRLENSIEQSRRLICPPHHGRV